MLLPKRHSIYLAFITALTFSVSAYAGLYGFSNDTNPQTPQYLEVPPRHITNYRKHMRNLIISISDYAKSKNSNFQIIPHEGQYLLNKSIWEYHQHNYNQIRQSDKLYNDNTFLSEDAPLDETNIPYRNKYINAIDGIVINNRYSLNTPIDSSIINHKLPILSIEQCKNEKIVDNVIHRSLIDKSIIYPFVDYNNAFRKIHQQLIINENAENIYKISQAKNINFLLEDELYNDPYMMLQDIRNSNYDIVVINPIFQNTKAFKPDDVEAMKFKKNGARRLIIAQYNISEVSEHDYLWKKGWTIGSPDFIATNSLVNENTYITKYWKPEWHKLMSHYIKSIIDSGYDGLFLTGTENHRYFEQNIPLE